MSKNIYQRISAVMEKVNYVRKESKKVNNQYTFVSHDAVTGAIQPHLVEEGIVVVPTVTNRHQDGNRTVVDIKIDFVNIEKPEDKFSVEFFGYGIDQQDKGPGKAFSYAKKYAFLQVFCLETGDDPERENLDHKPAQKKTARTKTAVAKDIKAFCLAMTNTETLEALNNFTNAEESKALIKELNNEWPEEFKNLKAEKEKQIKRLEANPKEIKGDPETLLDDLVRKMKSEKSEKNCQEMFKLGKFDLLSADAGPMVIAEYEREYNEHVNNLMMGN